MLVLESIWSSHIKRTIQESIKKGILSGRLVHGKAHVTRSVEELSS
jgi:hypothetical protein